MAGTMSVPRSIQRMVTVPRGRGTSARMKKRKGERERERESECVWVCVFYHTEGFGTTVKICWHVSLLKSSSLNRRWHCCCCCYCCSGCCWCCYCSHCCFCCCCYWCCCCYCCCCWCWCDFYPFCCCCCCCRSCFVFVVDVVVVAEKNLLSNVVWSIKTKITNLKGFPTTSSKVLFLLLGGIFVLIRSFRFVTLDWQSAQEERQKLKDDKRPIQWQGKTRKSKVMLPRSSFFLVSIIICRQAGSRSGGRGFESHLP